MKRTRSDSFAIRNHSKIFSDVEIRKCFGCHCLIESNEPYCFECHEKVRNYTSMKGKEIRKLIEEKKKQEKEIQEIVEIVENRKVNARIDDIKKNESLQVVENIESSYDKTIFDTLYEKIGHKAYVLECLTPFAKNIRMSRLEMHADLENAFKFIMRVPQKNEIFGKQIREEWNLEEERKNQVEWDLKQRILKQSRPSSPLEVYDFGKLIHASPRGESPVTRPKKNDSFNYSKCKSVDNVTTSIVKEPKSRCILF